MGLVEFKEMKTPWGILRGRDAIYLDWLSQAGNVVEMSGKINGSLSERREMAWFHYLISLRGVFHYEAFEFDVFEAKSTFRHAPSSVDEVLMPIDARTVERAREFGVSLTQFLVQTYDYVYLFAAASIQFAELWVEPMRPSPGQGRRLRP